MTATTAQGPLRLALFLLRISLGGFLLIWAFEKLLKPELTVIVFKVFYHLEITPTMATALGIPQVLLSLAIIAGFQKTLTYGLGAALHAVSTFSTYEQLIDPYMPGNHLFLAAIPILVAFVVLYLMRKDDTLLALSKGKRKATKGLVDTDTKVLGEELTQDA